MTIRNANSHPYQVEVVKDGEDTFYANSHPFKVAIVGGGGGGAEARVVDELPETGEVGYIYLVLKEHTSQGDIYDEYVWALQQDGTTYAWEHLGSTNEVTIVLYDTTGTNTDGAMTQNATTSMVYADPATKTKVQIGNSTSGGDDSSVSIGTNITADGNRAIAIGERTDNTIQTASGPSVVSIGVNTKATQSGAVALSTRASATGQASTAIGVYSSASRSGAQALGYYSNASGDNSIAMGYQAQATGANSIAEGDESSASSGGAIALGAGAEASEVGAVALGSYSRATRQGEINVGTGNTHGVGYNLSLYRLISGVYDPQDAHDAATKGYTDNLVISYAGLSGQGAPTSSTAATYLGQFYYDTTNGKLYICTDATNPYVWEEVGSGGGGVDVFTTNEWDALWA